MNDLVSLPNRPMLPEDLAGLGASPWPGRVRGLVEEFGAQGWPVLNGGFRYSSLTEGPSRMFTCHPYRLWEYSSILDVLSHRSGKLSFLDAGGAGSALPYLLSSMGHDGVAVDAQPWLADLCRHIAGAQGLPLKSAAGDLTRDDAIWSSLHDVVICVSVLEHIPASRHAEALRRLAGMVKPGGLLCLTFDYGTHTDRGHPEAGAIQDIKPVCDSLTTQGLRFHGKDPRDLPASVLAMQTAPEAEQMGGMTQSTLGATDNATPWRSMAGRALRKLGIKHDGAGRFGSHNFFRMFLERPAAA